MDKSNIAIIVIAFLLGHYLAEQAADTQYPMCAAKNILYYSICPTSERTGWMFGRWIGYFLVILIILYVFNIVAISDNTRQE